MKIKLQQGSKALYFIITIILFSALSGTAYGQRLPPDRECTTPGRGCDDAAPKVAPTISSPSAVNVYEGQVTVSLSNPTIGASIYYTVDNTEVASAAIATKYSAPLTLTANTTVRAKGFGTALGLTPGDESIWSYKVSPVRPVITPNGGTYEREAYISLTSVTPGTTIRYTTNNTAVTASSAVYSMPIRLTQNTNLRARAFKAGMTDSAEQIASFTILQPAALPLISPAGGTHTGNVNVSLSTATAGATLRYTTNNTAVTTSSPVYSGPLVLTANTTVRVKAFKSGMAASDERIATFAVKPYLPAASPNGGTFTGSVPVTLSSATSGTTLRYTTNNTAVTASSAVYSGALSLGANTVLRVRAYKTGMTDSDELTTTFTLKPHIPVISPNGGTFTGSVSVTLSSATNGTTLRYTTNNTAVTATSAIYSGSLALTDNTTLRVRAFRADMAQSDERQAEFTVYAADNGGVTYIHTDVLGSVIAETDETGRFKRKTDYKPFGSKENQ